MARRTPSVVQAVGPVAQPNVLPDAAVPPNVPAQHTSPGASPVANPAEEPVLSPLHVSLFGQPGVDAPASNN
ncbi:hypothetical protein FRC09_002004 [Ceratobasidium sp. 395]|nr:hypothetical protein FRC09_002004 [Ceratobasidium sp. 395]